MTLGGNRPKWIIVDDVLSDHEMTPETRQWLVDWHRDMVERGAVGIGSIRIPDGEDLLKVLLDSADEEA